MLIISVFPQAIPFRKCQEDGSDPSSFLHFKTRLRVLRAVCGDAKPEPNGTFRTAHVRILAELLSWTEISLPPRQVCYLTPPAEEAVFRLRGFSADVPDNAYGHISVYNRPEIRTVLSLFIINTFYHQALAAVRQLFDFIVMIPVEHTA